jgi:uncharacterized protein (TIGR02678 family)
MASIEEQDLEVRRARAIQDLLERPLMDRRQPSFDTIATSEHWLKDWFFRTCGWVLIVDYRHGMARLRKVTAVVDTTSPLRSLRHGNKPFTKRQYVVFCLVTAALGEHGRSRVSLQDIAMAAADLSVRAVRTPFNDLDRKDRQAMVDVLQSMTKLGVVSELDRSGRDYSSDRGGNVLYQIDERRLAQLLVAPVPPARCTDWRQMMVEDRHRPHDLDGPSRLAMAAAKQRLMRRLLDRPVCYPADLDPDEAAVMRDSVAEIRQWLGEAGLDLEIRADAWMVVHRRAAAQRTLRDGSNVANAALLLLDTITQSDVDWISATQLGSIVDDLLARYSWWAKSLRKDPRRVDAVTTLLAAFDLIRPESNGWAVMPAAWRWKAAVAPDSFPAAEPAAEPDALIQDDLFTVEPM